MSTFDCSAYGTYDMSGMCGNATHSVCPSFTVMSDDGTSLSYTSGSVIRYVYYNTSNGINDFNF